MGQILSHPNLIKVICLGCAKQADHECPICSGSRFHLWDPNTLLCYGTDGTQLFAPDSSGEMLPVTRAANMPTRGPFSLEEMLNFIELWVLESPVRKWKLTMDEEGWHACVWFNRYKKLCFDTSDTRLEPCIERCYLEIQNGAQQAIR